MNDNANSIIAKRTRLWLAFTIGPGLVLVAAAVAERVLTNDPSPMPLRLAAFIIGIGIAAAGFISYSINYKLIEARPEGLSILRQGKLFPTREILSWGSILGVQLVSLKDEGAPVEAIVIGVSQNIRNNDMVSPIAKQISRMRAVPWPDFVVFVCDSCADEGTDILSRLQNAMGRAHL